MEDNVNTTFILFRPHPMPIFNRIHPLSQCKFTLREVGFDVSLDERPSVILLYRAVRYKATESHVQETLIGIKHRCFILM